MPPALRAGLDAVCLFFGPAARKETAMDHIINHSFDAIPKSYLFSEVARRVAAFRAAHPERELIPMGIGDVTRPLRRPVIEALKKLNMMGILDIRQGRGTFVKPVDLSLFMKPLYQLIDFEDVDIESIYSARKYLETGTASMAAEKRTEEDVARLGEILGKLKEAIETEDLIAIEGFDSQFHLEVAKTARNPILYACLEAIEEINRTCLKRFSKYLTVLDDCYGEHYRIFDAIRKGDAAGASQAMLDHTLSSQKVLL